MRSWTSKEGSLSRNSRLNVFLSTPCSLWVGFQGDLCKAGCLHNKDRHAASCTSRACESFWNPDLWPAFLLPVTLTLKDIRNCCHCCHQCFDWKWWNKLSPLHSRLKCSSSGTGKSSVAISQRSSLAECDGRGVEWCPACTSFQGTVFTSICCCWYFFSQFYLCFYLLACCVYFFQSR